MTGSRRRSAAVGAALAVLLAVIVVEAMLSSSGTPTHAKVVNEDVRITEDHRSSSYRPVDGGSDRATEACSTGRRQQNEPAAAVDPHDPRVIVVGANDSCPQAAGDDPWVGYYRSTDGGRTFRDSLVPGYGLDDSKRGLHSPAHDLCQAAFDPSVAFDTSGRLYFAFLCERSRPGRGLAGERSSVLVARFVHDGADYVGAAVVARGTSTQFHDKVGIAVDRSGGRRDGTVYVAWSRSTANPEGYPNLEVQVARSSDGGRRFSGPVPVVPNPVDLQQSSALAIGPTGTVYAAFYSQPSNGVTTQAVWVAASTDGARSFQTPALVSQFEPFASSTFTGGAPRADCGDGPFACQNRLTFARFETNPSIAADRNGIHLAWNARSRTGQSRVLVSSSRDGSTWSPPAPVDPQPRGHQYLPSLAAGDGALTLIFYDSRADRSYSPDLPPGLTPAGTNSGPAVDVYAARSTDGGRTWHETRLTPSPFQPNYELGFSTERIPFNGDYISVSAASGSVFAAWTDLRDVVPGRDPRETSDSDDDGFDVRLPCSFDPDGVGARSYRSPAQDDRCLSSGGLDENVYGAALGPRGLIPLSSSPRRSST